MEKKGAKGQKHFGEQGQKRMKKKPDRSKGGKRSHVEEVGKKSHIEEGRKRSHVEEEGKKSHGEEGGKKSRYEEVGKKSRYEEGGKKSRGEEGGKRKCLDAMAVGYFRRVRERLSEGFADDEERGKTGNRCQSRALTSRYY